MNKKLEDYEAAFGEPFPLMQCMGMSDEAITKIVDDCLKRNAPYAPEIGNDDY